MPRRNKQPGQKNKQSGPSKKNKKYITPRKWAEEVNKLMGNIPKGLTDAQASQWINDQMNQKFRMRTRLRK